MPFSLPKKREVHRSEPPVSDCQKSRFAKNSAQKVFWPHQDGFAVLESKGGGGADVTVRGEFAAKRQTSHEGRDVSPAAKLAEEA